MLERDAKRQRTGDDTPPPCVRFSSSFGTYMAASLHASVVREAGISPGSRIQVLWTLEEEEGRAEDVWWSCTVLGEGAPLADGRSTWRLRYDAAPDLGFEAEDERDVCFVRPARGDAVLIEDTRADGVVVDVVEHEAMPWRREHDVLDAEGMESSAVDSLLARGSALPPGTRVKAFFQGGEKAYAGTVHAVRCPATAEDEGDAPRVLYDVLYEDMQLEQGVPADLVVATGAPGAAAAVDGDIAATSIDEFFELFVKGVTSGQVFRSLDAHRQRLFADCVQRSRPHFARELATLADERGLGTTVTSEDITDVILPRIMPHMVQTIKDVTG